MRRLGLPVIAMIALMSCRQEESAPAAETDEPVAAPAGVAVAPASPDPGTPGGLPDDRTPLEEPEGPIDPRSTEAAGQVMQHYGALIEQEKFAEAERFWSDPVRARGLSDDLSRNREVHLQVGRPGQAEGAAGSVYVAVPLVLYGVGVNGAPFRRSGDATLRRVNDVPGSTAEQRTWRIESMAFLERS